MATAATPKSLVSWNVNGIRACLKKGFLDYVADAKPDVVCVQETKAAPEQVDLQIPGYHQFWNAAEKKGYSGTLVLTRVKPKEVWNGLDLIHHDNEGRVITVEYDGFYLVNVYTPNAQNALARLDYRMAWDADFLKYLLHLEKTKPVVTCGDFNVSHQEIDLARPKENVKNAGFTPQEREGFDRIVQAGYLDSFREFTTGGGHYSWWSMRGGARERNVGWRLDYFLLSRDLRPKLKSATIQPQVLGSDHCPVTMELKR